MIWIAGKLFSDFSSYLHGHGLAYGLFTDKNLVHTISHNVPKVALDFTRPDTFEDQLASYDLEVSAVMVAGYENYVLPAAHLAKIFNVPGITCNAALAATDKAVMRTQFLEYDPEISPKFAEVESWQDVDDFMRTHHFPVMLKPASLMKSLLITKNTSLDELRRNYHDIQQKISGLYQKYSVSQHPKIIIEEYMTGSMHTVAGFADAAGTPHLVPMIADCATAIDIGRQDNFIYNRQLPSQLKPHQQSQILEVAAKGMRALNLTSVPAHIELMQTAYGPKIIEIGARIGGYRARMYQQAAGIDLYAAAIATSLNQSLDLQPHKRAACSVIELFPEAEGKFYNITNIEALKKLPSVDYWSVKAKPGATIGQACQGYKAAAVIMLSNPDDKALENDYAFVLENVRVNLQI